MKRFLCDREGIYKSSPDGFLEDPDGDYGRYLNLDVVTFDSLHECQCLIVLGEPGIGKSTEIERMAKIEKLRLEDAGDKVLHCRLRNHLKTKSNNNSLLLQKCGCRIRQAAIPQQGTSELQLRQVIFALPLVTYQQAPALG